MKWDIFLLLPDGENQFKLCTVETVETLTEVLRILFNKGVEGPQIVIVKVRHE